MIDRRTLVGRHAVVQRAEDGAGIDARSPVSVGNGDFAVTVDLTGLHTLPDSYPAPGRYGEPAGTLLGMQSNDAWHSTPPWRPIELDEAKRRYRTDRGEALFVDLQGATSATGIDAAPRHEQWLRNNPHRLLIGLLGLVDADGAAPAPTRFTDLEQRLDPWNGEVASRFRLDGLEHRVRTVAAGARQAAGWRLSRADGAPVRLRLRLPYGSEAWGNAADFDSPDRHRTTVTPLDGDRWWVQRELDADRHCLLLHVPSGALRSDGHHLELTLGSTGEVTLELVTGAEPVPAAGFEELRRDSAAHWRRYWTEGAMVSIEAPDPRAVELERRVVLSQYQLKVHSAGRLPPQETGLMVNSWRGRFHGEMHWWHVAHFALWGRAHLVERSLGWYEQVLPMARDTAAEQRLPGARWPKQTGPDGRESPSDIGPFLIWQQPHPIFLAELVRRQAVQRGDSEAEREIRERHGEVVRASADCMAGLVSATPEGWSLGPPLIPAQESYGAIRTEVRDPTFELAYWVWAMRVAADWSTGAQADRLRRIAGSMVRPTVRDGCYQAIAGDPWTIRRDHPSMLAALGMIPDTGFIDHQVMAATLDSVLADWDWESAWGWDHPVLAMCATRLHRPEVAVDALLADRGKNTYLVNGHNFQNAALPIYLPGNGGLLAAVAMMAGGWDGSEAAPGFPADWRVVAEGLVPWPA